MRTILLTFSILLTYLPLHAQEKNAWPRPDPGANSVETTSHEWADDARKRVVPVRIYFPKKINQPAPVIVYSHGTGGSREGYAYLGKFWASHGYIVVHPQHAGSDGKSVIGTGKLIDGIKKAAFDPKNAVDRPKDIRFVLDKLANLNKDNDSPLHGKLNLDAVGLAGHSFGAHTTLVTAGQWMGGLDVRDKRVKAIIPMSAPVPKAFVDKAYTGITIPSMHMTGTLDDSPIGDTKAKERRVPFDKIQMADKYLINFEDGDHMIFSGRATLKERKKDAEFQRCIKQASLAFWDCYLKNDAKAAAWLTGKGMPDYVGKLATIESKIVR